MAEIMPHPSVGFISGRRGAGKSALGYYLLEHLSKKNNLSAYVLGLPKSKWNLLPSYIQPIEFGRDLPESSVIFIDEAALTFYSRDTQKRLNKVINTSLSLARQKDQTILFAGHTLRAVDVGIIMNADAIMMKEPSKLHMSFERAEIRELTRRAWKLFDGVKDPLEKKRRVVLFSSDLYGEVMENPLPTFWSEELSRAFATVPLVREETERVGGRPELTEWDREILRRILEVEESGGYDKRFGWKVEDVGLTGGLAMKFIALGLVRRGYTSRSSKHFYGNVEKIREALGLSKTDAIRGWPPQLP